MASYFQFSILFLFLAGSNYFTLAQKPDYTETWKGNHRLIAVEDVYPFERKSGFRWVRGWGCGWTPYGLCFSPDWRKDIHDFYIIPFKNLVSDVYCDQPANTERFGMGSTVLARFSNKRDMLMEGIVYQYNMGFSWATRKFTTTRIFVRTEYIDLGVKRQFKDNFHPNQVRLKGNHNACRYLKTDCKSNEVCVPRRLSGRIWPAEYKCVCKRNGWKAVRGRGCVDVDECAGSPCGALFVCVNTAGSYKCECQTGYTGTKCDVEIDECKQSPCPENSQCKNVPGSFQCTCLPGFTGKDCSEFDTEDSEIKAPTIKDYTNKRIAIPRKRPTKTIRTPVFLYEPRHQLRAAMIALIVVLNSLGIALFCWYKWKRSKQQERERDSRPSSNLELQKEETILGHQDSEKTEDLDDKELNLSKTILSNGEQLNREMISNNEELNISSEKIKVEQKVEINEVVVNDQELQNSVEIPSHQKLDENAQVFSSDQELKLSELKNIASIPSSQVLENGGTIQENQELQDGETPLKIQNMLENTKAISNHQDYEHNEAIQSNQEVGNPEAVLVTDDWENMEVPSRNQTLVTPETHIAGTLALKEEEIVNDREFLID